MQIPQNIYCSLFSWLYLIDNCHHHRNHCHHRLPHDADAGLYDHLRGHDWSVGKEFGSNCCQSERGKDAAQGKKMKRNMLCIYAKYINTCKIDANICIYANIAKYSIVKRAFPSVGSQLHMSWSHGNRKVQTVKHIYYGSVYSHIFRFCLLDAVQYI